jgi:heterodisulfide reductase subunit C
MIESQTVTLQPSPEFAQIILKECGENVNLCYQCKKCSSGCPLRYMMDYSPAQLIHAIRLGMKDLVYNSKTTWLCASCQTCNTRCPQEIDIPLVFDTAKSLVMREKKESPIPNVYSFYKEALRNIKWFGRLYELGLIMGLKLRTKEFFKDVGLGMKMFTRGKLKIFPSISISRTVNTWKIFSNVKRKEKEKIMEKK